MRVLALMVLFLLVVACQPTPLEPGPEVKPPPPPPIRPYVPIVDLPEELPAPTRPSTAYGELRGFLNASHGVRKLDTGILVGTDDEPFLLGEKLGELLPILTRLDLPFLAAADPRPDPQLNIPGLFKSEQLVRFDFDENTSGVLQYGPDQYDERVGSELFFAEDAPVVEFAYLLYEGNFQALVGTEFDFFGHRYWLKEASNTSLELYGVDVEKYLFLSDDQKLKVNGNLIRDTRVHVDQWSVIITYYADDVDDDGIRLQPGDTLREKFHEDAFLNPVFDIAFDGFEGNTEDALLVESVGDEARLSFLNLAGELVEFRTGCPWGTSDGALHLFECEFCIAEDDRFVLTGPGGVTSIFEFRSLNQAGTVVTLRDHVTGEQHVVEVFNESGEYHDLPVLEGELRLYGAVFRIRALLNESPKLSVALDGDGSIGDERVPVVLKGGYELEFAEDACNITFVVPETPVVDEEEFTISLAGPARDLLIGTDLTLYETEDDSERWRGITTRGIVVTLESENGVLGEELLVAYPRDYSAGLVRILG
jgi:hypothetical protein